MNFVTAVIERRPVGERALTTLDANGDRRTYSFGELAVLCEQFAGALAANGVHQGSVVMTVMGSRPQWVIAMLAVFRLGAVALPCVAQSRPSDIKLRMTMTHPAAIVASEETAAAVHESGPSCPVLVTGAQDLPRATAPPIAHVAPEDPALMIFTSGTSGHPKAVLHGTRYLFGQRLQGEYWLDARPGDLVWCTAAAGWSKSARNAFVAPWLRGAAAFLHDARFDPIERLELLRRERINVLCMAPTEYRMTIRRARLGHLPTLRSAVAAGEALDADTVLAWRDGTGVDLRDGYGQTETGAVTGIRPGDAQRPGSMGRPLPGLRTSIVAGELTLDVTSSPTFCLGYLGRDPIDGTWATGDLVEQDEDGFLWFRGRADDVIISAGYRVGPTEVEEALSRHPAVAETAVVGAPDAERGEVIRAVVVLSDGWTGGDALVQTLQEHVRTHTAPYKYPRIVDFVQSLPRTASGKVQRAALRGERRW